MVLSPKFFVIVNESSTWLNLSMTVVYFKWSFPKLWLFGFDQLSEEREKFKLQKENLI